MRFKNILITGGAGFIGSNIAKYFNKYYPSSNLFIFDKFNNGDKFKNGNYKYLGTFKNINNINAKVISGDICNNDDLKLLHNIKFDLIFHMAAISDTRASNEELVMKTNLNSFYEIISIAEKSKSKLVYASSASTYGSTKFNIQKIGQEDPNNIYGYSKLMMDNYTTEYLKNKPKIEIVGLRYFNVYGFGEDSKGKTASTILQFYNNIKNNRITYLFKNSEKIFRDFIYINDVVSCTVNAAVGNKIGLFNVGTGKERSFLEVYNILKSYLNSSIEPEYIENPFTSGYQNYTKADISRTVRELKFEPKYSLEDGIKNYIEILENI